MSPKNLFLIVLAVGLVGVLAAFFVTKMGDSDDVTEDTSPTQIEIDDDLIDQNRTANPFEDDNEDEEDADDEDDSDESDDEDDTSSTDPRETSPVDQDPSSTSPKPQPEQKPTQDTSDESDQEGADSADIATRLETEKVIHYYNSALSYGLLAPNNNYYSGFGPVDGARHTVGFSSEGIPDTLDDAQVRVYFYGSTKPSEDDAIQLSSGAYVRVETDDTDSATYTMILETIYTGENQAPEQEETSESDDES